MAALCRACAKPIAPGEGGTLFHYRPCFALKPREDGRGCAICNRVKTGVLYCSTPVCLGWRRRAARARTALIKAGVIEIVHRCSCGARVEHQHDVGTPARYCSEKCRRKEWRVREREQAAARRHANPPRDVTKCSMCNENPRHQTPSGRLRSWCKSCEARHKREHPNPNLKLRSRGLRPGKTVVLSDAS